VSHLPRPVFRLLVVLAALLALGLAGFGTARAAMSGRVLGDVTVIGVPLGGLSPADAERALAAEAGRVAVRPTTVHVEESSFTLRPSEIGFTVDIGATVDAAVDLGRAGSIPGQFWWWLTHLLGSVTMAPVTSLDPDAVEEALAGWEEAALPDLPFEGAIETDGTEPVAVPPRAGRRIDREAAPGRLVEGVLGGEAVRLPVVGVEPRVSGEAVAAALEAARRLLAGDVVLAADAGEVTMTPPQLAEAFRSEPTSAGELRLFFDPGTVAAVLEPSLAGILRQPVDASFVVDGYRVSVAPGSAGTDLDAEATARSVGTAAASPDRRGLLVVRDGAEPAVTTADLESLHVTHLVSRFTTYHDCCQNRVRNIHLIADTVDGTIVRPGEELSLNGLVGRRTVADGYLEDGTIIGGELTTSVGGGVSQFATTFYNAVFWGGYDDVSHKPHSFYFSRYPEGIEATISFPAPDLVFRNDSETGILIRTEYTDTSITVSFYGDNDGRIVSGRHRNGATELTVVEAGGPAARVVTASVSDRYNPTNPGAELRPNPGLQPGQRRQVQKPSPGWTVKVTRTITVGGTERPETWTVRYSPRREIVEVNPCEIPELATPCPTTTTTTTPPPTTTTTTP